MGGFGGYGSGEINIVLLGGFIGFFVGLSRGGLKGGLLGSLLGSVGLFIAFLLLVFICWAIGNLMIKIKGMNKAGDRK